MAITTTPADTYSAAAGEGLPADGPLADGPPADSPLARLTPEQLDELAKELDAIGDEVRADLGERDAQYIRSTIALQRRLVVGARALLTAGSRNRGAWLVGTAALSVAKILENMEIGHNVMHGQWDWMNDPDINSKTWDWDTASPAEAWRHSHNYEHHTFTNIRGKDRDLGYEIMRIDPQQKWYPIYLLQPLFNLLLMGFFEWGVALHDLNYEAIGKGEKSKAQAFSELKAIGAKARKQVVKDYIAFPALSAAVAGAAAAALTAAADRSPAAKRFGRSRSAKAAGAKRGWRRARPGLWPAASRPKPSAAAPVSESARQAFKATLAADFTANIVRNVWAHGIIFCGHFPDQTYTFSQREVENETRGGWFVRQMLGSANIEGSPLFHFMAGNLSFQVEHHLYPDMPSSRYTEIAPRVREVCRKYDLPYNTGPLGKQLGTVHRTILRLSLPGGGPKRRPRPAAPGRA